ncbi:HIT domain-containing protein [Streptomyces sp. YC504]|uniref:HIT domain-containing protein n=1 Tax=Streptomyces mesophilus TaxID=1775132 RepID=A0A6G4XL19_9ACTN|nr:HIT domain-containing protein [Streptomyces mesophilus]NGO78235.1 HIT domain-containing protein [Streptomyces mesophilus]
MSEPCPFCEIVAGRAFAQMVAEWDDVVAFRPLNAVTREHTLVVPRTHVRDFASDPEVSAATMRRAAELMRGTSRHLNLITSRGAAATQSVFHLHLHLVPRTEGDGLALPWHDAGGSEVGQDQPSPCPQRDQLAAEEEQ